MVGNRSSWGGGGGGMALSSRMPSEASRLLLRLAKYLYHVEMPNSAARGAAVMPPVPVWTVSSHWSNIDLDCRVRARCYPMRMEPSWIISLDCISAQAAQIYTQILRSFLLGGAAVRICMQICIACLHVGQMLVAGNKYLLLKRITVYPYLFMLNIPIQVTFQSSPPPIRQIETREYWMIYRAQNFLSYHWLLLHPLPLPSANCLSFLSLTVCRRWSLLERGEEGVGKEPNHMTAANKPVPL